MFCWRCRTSTTRRRQILPQHVSPPIPEAMIPLCDTCNHWYSSAMLKATKKALEMSVPNYLELEEKSRAAQRFLNRPEKRNKRTLTQLDINSPEQAITDFTTIHRWKNIATEASSWGILWFLIRHFGFSCPPLPILKTKRFNGESCLACGTRREITKHHVIPKSFMSFMEAPLIFAPLCYSCHKAYEKKASQLKRFLLGAICDHPLVLARKMVWDYLDSRIQDPSLKFQIRCHFFDLIEGGNVKINQEDFFRLTREDLVSLSAQTDLFGQTLMKLLCENIPSNIIINTWLSHFARHGLNKKTWNCVYEGEEENDHF